jgi:single-strand DNA-binding protein
MEEAIMLASVTVIGNMGKDVEVRNTSAGARVASFSLAVSRYEKGGKKTMWVNVVCWDEKKIDLLQSYTSKGSKLYVRGDLSIREYNAKDGSTKTATEVVIGKFGGELGLLDRKSESDTGPAKVSQDSGDDIPF